MIFNLEVTHTPLSSSDFLKYSLKTSNLENNTASAVWLFIM